MAWVRTAVDGVLLHKQSTIRGDNVTVESHGCPYCRQSFQLVLPLVLGVEGQESQNEEIHGCRKDGQAEENEEETEYEVLRLLLEIFVSLKGHVVPEADGGECDDAIVEGIKVGPSLDLREGVGSTCNDDAGHVHADEDQVGLRNIRGAKAKALLEMFQ